MPLRIVIPAETTFDDATQKFTDRAERVLTLEHSLLSMALWEAEYKQCFSTAKLDPEMFRFYISCMTDEVLSDEELRVIERLYKNKIVSYMFDDRYAKKTTPSKSQSQGPQSRQSDKSRFLPTEEFYYAMFERGIPIACERWHFSRLANLLEIYSAHDSKQKGKKGKKSMSSDQYRRMAEINRSRLNNGGS